MGERLGLDLIHLFQKLSDAHFESLRFFEIGMLFFHIYGLFIKFVYALHAVCMIMRFRNSLNFCHFLGNTDA